ncbi:unnamed protein product, partial [Closterium sp. NIES-64]
MESGRIGARGDGKRENRWGDGKRRMERVMKEGEWDGVMESYGELGRGDEKREEWGGEMESGRMGRGDEGGRMGRVMEGGRMGQVMESGRMWRGDGKREMGLGLWEAENWR